MEFRSVFYLILSKKRYLLLLKVKDFALFLDYLIVLNLLVKYEKKLATSTDTNVKMSLAKVISALKSKHFDALLGTLLFFLRYFSKSKLKDV